MKYRKEILGIALPAMVENILQMMMGVVDNYLVAQVGLFAVSGVSVANNILSIYQALFIALGATTSSFLARKKSQNSKEIREVLSITFWLAAILGVISVLFSPFLITRLGAEAAVARQGGLYLAIVGGGSASLAYMTTLSSILRVKGKNQLPAYVSLLSNVLNALLSALAVFVFGFGVWGVAAATVLSRLLGCLILKHSLNLSWKIFVPKLKLSWNFLSQSLPIAGERLMMRLGDVVVVAITVQLGTEVVAGNAIGETLTQFNYMPGLAVATAVLLLSAKFSGTNHRKEISRLVLEAYLLATALMLVISSFVLFFGQSLISAFTQNTLAQSASLLVLFFSFIGTPATAGTLIYTATWQGLGQSKKPFYATTLGMWGIRVVFGYLLAMPLGLGLAGVWLATLLDNLFRWGFLYIKFNTLKK